jgi:hypothetical protein
MTCQVSKISKCQVHHFLILLQLLLNPLVPALVNHLPAKMDGRLVEPLMPVVDLLVARVVGALERPELAGLMVGQGLQGSVAQLVEAMGGWQGHVLH